MTELDQQKKISAVFSCPAMKTRTARFPTSLFRLGCAWCVGEEEQETLCLAWWEGEARMKKTREGKRRMWGTGTYASHVRHTMCYTYIGTQYVVIHDTLNQFCVRKRSKVYSSCPRLHLYSISHCIAFRFLFRYIATCRSSWTKKSHALFQRGLPGTL